MEYDSHQNGRAIVSLLLKYGLFDISAICRQIGDPDRTKHFRLFEYAVARKYSMLLWAEIPAEVRTSRSISKADMGIDCVSPDGTRAVQAKWLRPGACVSHPEISTFYMFNNAWFHATRLTIVTSEKVRLHKLCPKEIAHHILSHEELAAILVDVLIKYGPSAVSSQVLVVAPPPQVSQPVLQQVPQRVPVSRQPITQNLERRRPSGMPPQRIREPCPPRIAIQKVTYNSYKARPSRIRCIGRVTVVLFIIFAVVLIIVH